MRDQLNFTKRHAEIHRRFDPILQASDNTHREKNDVLEQMQNELQKITDDENRFTC
jgi:hypothetical protein